MVRVGGGTLGVLKALSHDIRSKNSYIPTGSINTHACTISSQSALGHESQFTHTFMLTITVQTCFRCSFTSLYFAALVTALPALINTRKPCVALYILLSHSIVVHCQYQGT